MSASVEEIIAGLARSQHGVVRRSQLIEAGVTARMVEGRVRSRRFRPLYQGVYGAGPVALPLEREMAAVLACWPPPAAVSHRSAAGLARLMSRPRDAAPVDVSFDGPDRGRRRGIRPHRVVRLEAEDLTEVEGIPTTTPARTLLDLAGVVTGRELEQALARALREGLTTAEHLASLLARRPGVRGIRALRSLLEAGNDPALTRSAAEERVLELVRSAQLPPPEVNASVGRYEVDFLWRAQGIGVEVDGFTYHGFRARFEHDRRRNADLAAEGVHVIQVTWRQVMHERDATLARVARTLGRAEGRAERRR